MTPIEPSPIARGIVYGIAFSLPFHVAVLVAIHMIWGIA